MIRLLVTDYAFLNRRRLLRPLVNILVFVINTLYRDARRAVASLHRAYPRFYVLETVARVPYFSYLSVLHLYETLGWWRRVDWLKVHFAESWNELHHLLIMESLGGGDQWFDRALARGAALIYYWVVVVMYLVSPRSAYYFMELVEGHAYHTYDTFLKEQGETLKQQPAPEIAVKYYRDGDLYMFDEFQSDRAPEERRPEVNNLYDVFVAIRDDEQEHVKTMVACQQTDAQKIFHSPHTEASPVLAAAAAAQTENNNE